MLFRKHLNTEPSLNLTLHFEWRAVLPTQLFSISNQLWPVVYSRLQSYFNHTYTHTHTAILQKAPIVGDKELKEKESSGLASNDSGSKSNWTFVIAIFFWEKLCISGKIPGVPIRSAMTVQVGATQILASAHIHEHTCKGKSVCSRAYTHIGKPLKCFHQPTFCWFICL